MNTARSRLLLATSLAAALVAPQVLSVVRTNMVVEFAILATYALSLNLLLNYAGLLSFGHALFFGTGAYATALALTHIDSLGSLTSLLLGALAAGLVALICSPLLSRVSGTAFAMLTLAFGQLMYVLCLKFREVTGGEDGIAGFPVPALEFPALPPLEITEPVSFYYFALLILGLGAALMWRLTRSPFGSLIMAIGDNEERVSHLGFKVADSKALLILLSAVFAGLAGSVFALFHNVVSTDGVLHLGVSFLPLMAIILGGRDTFTGPILGAAAFILVEDLSERFTENVELITGLLFVFVVLFLPSGLAGAGVKLARKVRAES